MGNLGNLSHIAEKDGVSFSLPNLDTFEPGAHFEGGAVFGSGILLIVLLGIAFERVLGLDKYFIGFMTKLKFSRLTRQRQQDLADRAKLERMYSEDKD